MNAVPKVQFTTEEELRAYVQNNPVYFNQYGKYVLYLGLLTVSFYPTEMGGVMFYPDGRISYNKWYGLTVAELDEDLERVLINANQTGIGVITLLSLLDKATLNIIKKLPIESQQQKIREFISRNPIHKENT